ncbi:ATP-binding protein [Streptomyces sp. NPDC002092]
MPQARPGPSARRPGLTEQRTYDLVTAVHEGVVNAVRHGGVRLHSDRDHVICEVSDRSAHTVNPPPEPAAVSGCGWCGG